VGLCGFNRDLVGLYGYLGGFICVYVSKIEILWVYLAVCGFICGFIS
jgi:hypothetical protein